MSIAEQQVFNDLGHFVNQNYEQEASGCKVAECEVESLDPSDRIQISPKLLRVKLVSYISTQVTKVQGGMFEPLDAVQKKEPKLLEIQKQIMQSCAVTKCIATRYLDELQEQVTNLLATISKRSKIQYVDQELIEKFIIYMFQQIINLTLQRQVQMQIQNQFYMYSRNIGYFKFRNIDASGIIIRIQIVQICYKFLRGITLLQKLRNCN
ncbi:hypothetical protein pb186bvf_004672, partial [Paramecium bursaria]